MEAVKGCLVGLQVNETPTIGSDADSLTHTVAIKHIGDAPPEQVVVVRMLIWFNSGYKSLSPVAFLGE